MINQLNQKYNKRILKEIAGLWKKNPEWRLGQLIFNVTQYQGDIFFLTDQHLLTSLLAEKKGLHKNSRKCPNEPLS